MLSRIADAGIEDILHWDAQFGNVYIDKEDIPVTAPHPAPKLTGAATMGELLSVSRPPQHPLTPVLGNTHTVRASQSASSMGAGERAKSCPPTPTANPSPTAQQGQQVQAALDDAGLTEVLDPMLEAMLEYCDSSMFVCCSTVRHMLHHVNCSDGHLFPTDSQAPR